MDKLVFDKKQRNWVFIETDSDQSIANMRKYKVLMEMFKTGDFFYLFHQLPEGKSHSCSFGVESLLGYSQKEVTTTFLFDRIHPDDRPAVEEFENESKLFFERLSQEERWNYKTRYTFRLKNRYGRYKQFMFQSIPFRALDNNSTEWLLIFSDICAFKSDTDQHLSFLHLFGDESFKRIRSIKHVTEILPLSGREREILRLLSKGEEKYKIAEKLNLSLTTVRNHLAKIKIKTRTKTMAELLAVNRELNLSHE